MRKLIAAALLLCGAAPLTAQTTGTPVFMAPSRAFRTLEVGGSLSDPGPGWALEGFYRYGYEAFDIGFRAGIRDNGETRALLGVDGRARVISHSEAFPLDGAVTVGFGGELGDHSIGFIPIGLSLGRRFDLKDSDVSMSPYVHPLLVPIFGDRDDVEVALGIGVDVRLTKQLDLRVSGAIGAFYEGLSVSLAFLR